MKSQKLMIKQSVLTNNVIELNRELLDIQDNQEDQKDQKNVFEQDTKLYHKYKETIFLIKKENEKFEELLEQFYFQDTREKMELYNQKKELLRFKIMMHTKIIESVIKLMEDRVQAYV